MQNPTDQPDTEGTDQLAEWRHRVPKVELHFHLEGSIPLDATWELVRKYGGDPTVPDMDALRDRFKFRDFPHFLETWTWKNGFIREYDDFTFSSEAVARSLADQNIRYVEAFLSPARFFSTGLETGRLIEAVRQGLDRVPNVEVALVPDLVRDLGAENAANVLSELSEVRSLGVVGIGIGGSEHLYPPEIFRDVYSTAREMGFHTTAHAGEAAGADSVWGAIQALEVERIGHGTRAVEDESLVQYLAESRLPIEMCPLSNVATRVVDSIDQHPVRDFFDRGLMVTINTDDPVMFGNSMAQEFHALETSFGFTPDEIRALILNGIEASWLSPERKLALAESFQSDPDWLDERS
ncbi:MAG: adenosine deaminase [SAR202 cluster bacterium]|jgi:adenosine deaminase|nr:adenosine deaminase [SAR202 cluster bacterium]MDP6713181.1 adenosine deaminase [SAR202 cluster bacterium]